MSELNRDKVALGGMPLAQALLNGSFARQNGLGHLPTAAASPEQKYKAALAAYEIRFMEYELGQRLGRLAETADGQALFEYLRTATVAQHHYDPHRHDDGINTIVEGLKRDGQAGVYWKLLGLIKIGEGPAPQPPEKPTEQEAV